MIPQGRGADPALLRECKILGCFRCQNCPQYWLLIEDQCARLSQHRSRPSNPILVNPSPFAMAGPRIVLVLSKITVIAPRRNQPGPVALGALVANQDHCHHVDGSL